MRVDRETSARHRAEIVRAASRLFRRHGFVGVGVAEITAAAGLTHGGFYGRFASKEALAAEATAAAFAEGRARLETGDLAGYVRGYLSRHHRDHPDEGCPLVALAAEAGRTDGDIATALADGAVELLAALAERLPERPDESAEHRSERAAEILALMVGAQVLARATRPTVPAFSDALLAALRRDLLARLAAPGPASDEGLPTDR